MRRAAFVLLSAAVFGSLVSTRTVMSQTPSPSTPASSSDLVLFIGTYTGKGSQGIYTLRLNPATGQLSAPTLAAQTDNPSFLAFHPSRPVLYAVNETAKFEGADGGGVTAFAVGAGGALTKVNSQSSKGGGPCYVTVDRTGTCVLVANYGTGSVAALPLEADGRLKPASSTIQHEGSGANPKRQKGPHAHSINLDASGRYAVAADLGIDKLLIYTFDGRAGTLAASDPPSIATAPGAGPRHFAFHPNGKSAYLVNELNSTITAYAWDAAHGTLRELQTQTTLPAGFTGESYPADVQVHPSGKFVYMSNRGHDSIAIFAVTEKDGTLAAAGHQSTGGQFPRHFGIDPTGAFLIAANQKTDSLVVFRIDPATGALTETGGRATLTAPVCVRFAPRSAGLGGGAAR